MKLQKGFSGFKLVTTSMFVIGIGLILFSIFSLIFFNERFFNESLPTLVLDSDAPTASQWHLSRETSNLSYQNKDSQDLQADIFSDADATLFEDAEMTEGEASPADGETTEISESEAVSESQEELFLGLTRSEIEAEIPVLEEEIRTNLTQAVTLYKDLISTDGMAGSSPEIAEWRDKTWAEVKQLFQEAARQKIPRYISYLRVTDGGNPLREGEWLSELMVPLPMDVTYGGTTR